METTAARLLARPILQEFDAVTVDVRAMNPAEFGKLAARHNLCGSRRSLSEGSGRLAQWMGVVIATVAAR